MAALSLLGFGRALLVPSTVPSNATNGPLSPVTKRGQPPSPPKKYDGSTLTVHNASELVQAVRNETVGTIVVAPGAYQLTSTMTGEACGLLEGPSALCIGRNLTIRAQKNGTVVLDAVRKRRVVYVAQSGRAQLTGLNITGGFTDGAFVGACCLNLPGTLLQRPAGFLTCSLPVCRAMWELAF